MLGEYPGAAPRPHVVIAAHLDTVFPEGTDVKVKREGAVLRGPGIGDDCRGLAVLVAIVREMKKANVQTPGTITFVANVGEEGLGDLRGVKELFNDTLKDQIDRFVSIDGTGVHVTNVAVGSHRYRVTFKGPGGHSFGAFGLANPIGAMGRAIAKIQRDAGAAAAEDDVQRRPRRRRHVGELDSVRRLDGSRHAIVGSGVARGGRRAASRRRWTRPSPRRTQRWGKPGMITVVKELVGDRPAGSTPGELADRARPASPPRRCSASPRISAKDRPTRTSR